MKGSRVARPPVGLIMLALGLCLVCMGCAPKRLFAVSVRELDSRRPVEGAKVVVMRRGINFNKAASGTTGSDGVVQVRLDAKDSDYVVGVDAPGRAWHRGQVRVGNLTPKGETVRAYVQEEIGPVVDARSLAVEVLVTTLK